MPILTYLLYFVSNLSESNIKELQLAIDLHALLAINCLKNKGPLHSPDVGDENPDVRSKQGHNGGSSRKNEACHKGGPVVPSKLVSYHF
jgi:hypothetical protein